MDEDSKLIRVYSGTELTVKLLQVELIQDGIPSLIKNDFKYGLSAGFIDGFSTSTDLFIKALDLKKAETIIKAFMEINDN